MPVNTAFIVAVTKHGHKRAALLHAMLLLFSVCSLAVSLHWSRVDGSVIGLFQVYRKLVQ